MHFAVNWLAVLVAGIAGFAVGAAWYMALGKQWMEAQGKTREQLGSGPAPFVIGFIVYGLLVYRQFDWRRLGPMLIETAALSGAILLIIGTATGMAWGLTQSGFSRALATAMTGLPGGSASFIAVSIVAFVILGSVLEGIPAIVLFGPLLFPIAKAVGVHEVHYAMIIILAMGVGLFAPPFGVGYYATCAIGRVSPDEGVRPIWGYLAALIIGLIVVAAVPWVSLGFLRE